uniref:hypothetical protein n=1 Tax=uncultured Kiloniella sp. TaxID=1133091 RepID=UPI00261B6C92
MNGPVYLGKQPPVIGCGDPGDQIEFSCRFDGAQHLSRMFGAGSNPDKWAVSFWIKRHTVDQGHGIFTAWNGSIRAPSIHYYYGLNNNSLKFTPEEGDSAKGIRTENLYRDPASWTHVYAFWDRAAVNAADRMGLIVNLKAVDLAQTGWPASNETQYFNTQIVHEIGRYARLQNRNLKASLAAFHFMDDLNPGAEAFAYLNVDNHPVPKNYQGDYGQSGFRFDFADPLDMGKDVSGNGNHFLSSGLTPAHQSRDTPTNNLPILNAVENPSTGTLQDGNLTYVTGGSGHPVLPATMIVRQGKWYFEYTSNNDRAGMGILPSHLPVSTDYTDHGSNPKITSIYYTQLINPGGTIDLWQSPWGNPAGNKTIGIAFDADTGDVDVYDESGWLGRGNAGAADFYRIMAGDGSNSYSGNVQVKFDENQWTYNAPDGYQALSVANLPCPDILNPDDYFTIRQRTSGGDVDDLPWNPLVNKTLVVSKRLDASGSWRVVDNVGDLDKWWRWQGTTALQSNNVLSFNGNGFSTASTPDYEGVVIHYIWRADSKSGFDIVEVDHVNGSPTTVTHNVGGPVEYAWVYNADLGGDRRCYHKDMSAGQYLRINSTAAASTDP